MRLGWKLEPKETGHRRIGAGPRGSILHDGAKKFASVRPLSGSYLGPIRGWLWVAGWDSDVPYKNTSNEPASTSEEAKAQAMAYIETYLAQRAQQREGQ